MARWIHLRLCLLTVTSAGALLAAVASAQATRPRDGAGAATSQTAPGRFEPVGLRREAAAEEVRPKIAHIRLAGTVLDSPPNFSLFRDPSSQLTLRDWLSRLAKARNDPRIAAVAVDVDSPQISWAQAQELADALRRLGEEKPVYTYLTSGTATEYLVASAGKHVSIEPTGTLYVTGLAVELLFFRGAMNWLGIEPQMIQIGRFKGAGEPLSRSGPSEEMLQTYNWLLDDLYDQLCSQIAKQRSLKVAAVKAAIDSAPLTAEQAGQDGFVDQLVSKANWPEQVGKKVSPTDRQFVWRKDYGRNAGKAIDPSNPFALLGLLFGGGRRQEIREPTVAIVHADGMIVRGRGGEGVFGQRFVGDKTLADTFGELRNDKRVKAVVFRVNSPGGSALASELIYQAVRKCAERKPVVVSIGQVGGSGGYYIAVGAKTILADPAGIVGSIGVISGKMAISGLLDKIRIGRHELTRGRNAGLRLSRPWNEREQAVIRRHAERTYRTFVQRVARSRGRRIKNIEEVSDGRVFTARQALGNGLVDRLGGLRDAITAAQKEAGIDKSYFISLPRPRTLMDMLAGDAGAAMRRPGGLDEALLRRAAKRLKGLGYMMDLAEILDRETVVTAMPHSITIRR